MGPTKPKTPNPDEIQYLLSRYMYDPITGQFTKDGVPYESTNRKGYRLISVAFKDYSKPLYAHRVAWFFHYGEWPPVQIDHINQDKSDNRICNLRLATNQQNTFNTAKRKLTPRRTIPTSSYKGVAWNREKGKWEARIATNGKKRFLGYFVNEEDAAAAYETAATELHNEFRSVQRFPP